MLLGLDVVFERCLSGRTAMRIILQPSTSIEEKRVAFTIHMIGQEVHVLYADIGDNIRFTILNDNEMLAAAVTTVAEPRINQHRLV